MDEPATKKARVDDFDDDGLEGLEELNKLEPLPQQDSVSCPSTSQAGPGGASGGAPSFGQAQQQPQQPQQGQSVLQELLMHQPPAANNSPRPPIPTFAVAPQPQQNAFNTRSPMTNGTSGGQAMMSPPSAGMVNTGRISNGPGPSPGGPQGVPQGPPGMRTQVPGQHPGMYGPPSGDPNMNPAMQQQQQQQYMMSQHQMRGGYPPQGYPIQQGPNQVAYPPQQGRGQPLRNQNPQMMNGAAMQQRQQQMAAAQRGNPGMMMNPMMQHPMMERGQFPNGVYPQQRPDQYMNGPPQGYMPGQGRGQYPAGMMPHHPSPQGPAGPGMMMMDPSHQNGPQMGMRPGPAIGQMPPGMQQHPNQMVVMPNGIGGPHPQNPAAQMQQMPRTDGSGSRTPGLGNGSGGPQDPEKRKLIQQQLVLLLHAHKCQQRERADPNNHENGRTNTSQCNLPHCCTMKEVLQHMTTCNNGRSCQCKFCESLGPDGRKRFDAHCASSRQIIAHWKNCQREDCPVCKPLKSIQNNPNGTTERIASGFGLSDMTSLLGPASAGGGPGSVSGSLGPQSADPLAQFGSPGPLGGGGMPTGPMNTAALLGDFQAPLDPFRSPNPPNKQVGAGLHGLPASLKGPGDFSTLDFPPPEVPNTDKDWHRSVTKDLRNHLVGKLVKAIFPSPDPNALQDQRIRDLINYARKVEKEMFETANDREEYYHLLAEKIYKIQKELQEKKNSRLKPELGDLSDLDMPNPPNRTLPSVPTPMPSGIGQVPGMPSHMGWPQPPHNMLGVSNSNQMPPQMSENVDPVRNALETLGGGGGNTSQSNSNHGSGTVTPNIKIEDDNSTIKMETSGPPSNNTPAATPGSVPISNGLPGGMIIKEEPGCSVTPGPSSNSTVPAKPVKPEAAAAKKEVAKRDPTPPPGNDRNFDPDELRNYLKPVWEKLDNSEDAVPFRVPVDPVLLNIPDYNDIVKFPMDLMTICAKLDNGHYTCSWDFCDDIWQMLDNAWLYNRKNSKVYKFSTKLSEMFMAEMDPIMRQMGYCCSRKLSFTPLALFCYGASMCTIARDQPYFVYEQSSTQYGVTVSERYTYCVKCFEALPPEGISLSENPADTTNMASKDLFKQMKNNVIDYEPFEVCKYCHRKWHRICALHDKKVYPEGFICETCRSGKSYPKPENKYTAKKLPHNKLSLYLEERVNGFMKTNMPNKSDQYEVIIRTLCVQDKEVEVKPQMKSKYAPQGFPERFPYRTKAIFAFEVIDGVEVCFFGLHVQEYGSNSKKPNQRRVYIAYLDSVHFFNPRELRTDVYHEILLGYLDYVKRLGYTMAHIWACPPSEGDDYIFHCHPPEQKIPKPKRLQDWYKKMLEKGVAEQTVVEFKDIYKQARDDQLTTPMSLPYFEGDFWPNVIEDCIREANAEEMNRKKSELNDVDEDEDDIFTTGDNGKKKSSKNKKNNLKKNSKMNKKKQGNGTGNEVADKLFSQFEKHKEVFFTIRLVTPQQEMVVLQKEVQDPDPLMASDMMDGRDTFLTRARDEHWEFSSLRRAKFSTLSLCYSLHETDSSKDVNYTCNKCQNQNAKWHCNTCEDFDLCDNCHKTTTHEHQLEQIKQLIPTNEGEASGGNRYESIQRCIQSLVHACQCRDANCRRMSCHKMKRVVQHTKMCKKRVNSSCPVCKQLIALCCYHAKHCSRDPCSVPFCMNIRQKLAEQKRSLARRADMMMRRRMEGLQAGVGGGVSAQLNAVASTSGVSNSHSSAPTPPSVSKPTAAVSANNAKGGGSGVPVTGMMGAPGGMTSMAPAHMMPSHQQQQQRPQYMGNPMMPGGMPNPMGQQPQQQHQQPQQQAPGMGQRYPMGGPQMPQHQTPGMMGPGPGQMTRPGGPQQPGGPNMMQGRPGQQGLPPPPYRAPGAPMNQYGSAGGMMNNNMGQMPMGQQQQPGMPGTVRPPQGNPPGSGGPQNERQLNAQLAQVEMRLKATRTQEEREALFNDLKKTPYLFSAFLKMSRNNEQNHPAGSGGYPINAGGGQAVYGGGPSQQQRPGPVPYGPMGGMGHQQGAWPQQQQQFQQRPQQQPPAVIAGQPFGQLPGRSPSMNNMNSSPMMQPGQQMMQPPQGQPDQGNTYR